MKEEEIPRRRPPVARIIVLSVILLLILAILAYAYNRYRGSGQEANKGGEQPTYADAQTAATQSLATFRKLITPQNYKELGFESADEIANATLGQPIRTSMVKLDQLKAFKTGDDPAKLLSDLNQVQYPITVRDQVRSSIAVEQVDGKWRASGFGQGGLAKQIEQIRRGGAAAASTAEASSQDMLVHVAAFNLYFVGRRVDDKLTLTPVTNYPAYNLRGGATMPAEEVFAGLATFAQQYNGLPM